MKYQKQPFFGIMFCSLLCAALLFSACGETEPVDSKSLPITAVSLVGTAALGWEDGDGDPLPVFMTKIAANTFEYEGTLTAGEFILSCDTAPSWDGRWFLPPGIRDVELGDGSVLDMVYSTAGNGGPSGTKWKITKDAKYRITADTVTKIIRCTETGDAESQGTNETFNYMYFIRCDTDAPVPFPMTKNGDNWTITITLERNNYIKFNGDDDPPAVWGTADEPDTSLRWFYPSANGISASETLNFKYGADSPNAWRISSAGEYTITLRPSAGTVTFESESSGGNENSSRLWLLYTKYRETDFTAGDSWELTENAGVYTWEGALDGWYKFMASATSPISYSGGLQFGPNTENAAPAGIPEDAFADSAYAWSLPLGYYTISLKPTDETVTIIKTRDVQPDDFTELWVFGIVSMKYEGSNFWDAPRNTARRMVSKGDGVFTWSYNFGSSGYFRVICRDNGIIFSPTPAEIVSTSPFNGTCNLTTERTMLSRSQLSSISTSIQQSSMSWLPAAGNQTITVDLKTRKIKQTAYNSGTDGPLADPNTGEDGGIVIGGTITETGGSTVGDIGTGEIDTATVSNILLYGSGCSTGWTTNQNASGAIKLYVQSPNVYAWKGPLIGGSGSDGQLKFHNGSQDIGPGSFTSVPGSGGSYPVQQGSGLPCWQISASGTYIVRLDMNTSQVSFIVQ